MPTHNRRSRHRRHGRSSSAEAQRLQAAHRKRERSEEEGQRSIDSATAALPNHPRRAGLHQGVLQDAETCCGDEEKAVRGRRQRQQPHHPIESREARHVSPLVYGSTGPSSQVTGAASQQAPPAAPPAASALPAETVEDRRRLARSYMPSTLSTDDVRTPVLPDLEAGVLGSGAPSTLPVLPTLYPQRPSTPALFPIGGAATSLTPPSVPLIPLKTVPFSHDDYLRWLFASPAKKREETERASTNSTAAKAAAVGLSGNGAAPTPVRAQRDASSPAAPPPSVDEIAYERSFFVATDWAAALAAPPLVAGLPRLPSLLAHPAPQCGGTVGDVEPAPQPNGGISVEPAKECIVAGGTRSSTPALSSPSDAVLSPLVSGPTRHLLRERGSTSVSAALTMSDIQTTSPLLSDPRATEGVLAQGFDTMQAIAMTDVSCESSETSEDAEEGLRVFVRHFQNGKVHTRPPWFLCSTLLNNCEHPYYVNWLDELDLGSVEEELALANAAQGSILGDS